METTLNRLDELAEAASQEIGSWPDLQPLPDALPSVPAFDPQFLPAVLRPWVMDISERMQCPPDFPAVSAITVAGSIIGRQLGIRPKRHDDWTVLANTWGACIGRPGMLKTPAMSEPMKMMDRLEIAAKKLYDTDIMGFEADQMVAKAEAKAAEKEIADAVKSGDMQVALKKAGESLKSRRDAPLRRRYKTSDPTVEKLGELLGENPRGMLLFRDELVGFLSALDKEGREGSRQFYLESWNGNGRFTFDRIGRGTVDIEAACVSILGAIQPGPLSDYMRRAVGSGDDGLIQRFQLLVWPDLRGKFRNVDRWPDTSAKTRAWECYQRLDALDPGCFGAVLEEEEIPYLRFDDEAQELFDIWRSELEVRLRSGNLPEAFESHLAKYRSLAPKLALIFHIIDGASGSVTHASLVRALAWCEYLEDHARRVYAHALHGEVANAIEISRHLIAGDLESPFTARQIYLKGWKGLDPKTTPPALEVLEDLGWLKSVHITTAGRPRRDYLINPRLPKK